MAEPPTHPEETEQEKKTPPEKNTAETTATTTVAAAKTSQPQQKNDPMETESETETEAKPETKTETKTKTEIETGPETEAEMESDAAASSKSKAETLNPFEGLDDDEVDGEGFDYVISETADGPAGVEESKENAGKNDGGAAMEVVGKEAQGLEAGGGEAGGEAGVDGQESKGPTLGYSHGFGGTSKVSKEVDEAMREFNVTTTNYSKYSNDLGRRHTPFEIDLDNVEEQPWRRPGATLDDYYNFGFNEQTWREYAAKQVALRLKDLQNNSQLAQANEQMQPQQQQQQQSQQPQQQGQPSDPRRGRDRDMQGLPPRGHRQRDGRGSGHPQQGRHESRMPPMPQMHNPPMPRQAPPPLPQVTSAPPLPPHAPPPS